MVVGDAAVSEADILIMVFTTRQPLKKSAVCLNLELPAVSGA